MRVCYLTRGGTVHDEVWLAELRKYFEVATTDLPDPRIEADIVQAGPLYPYGPKGVWYKATGAKFAAMSWGWDVLEPQIGVRVLSMIVEESHVAISDSNVVTEKLGALGAQRVVQFPWGVDLQQFTPKYDDKSTIPTFVGRNRGSTMIREAFGIVGWPCFYTYDVPHSLMPMRYHPAWAYVSSQSSDGSSVSLLEAMACGLPVIVYDSPGNREWVTRENGWLCNSVDSFARAIIEVTRIPPAERRRMGEANRAVVEARADWHKNFEKLVEVYHGFE